MIEQRKIVKKNVQACCDEETFEFEKKNEFFISLNPKKKLKLVESCSISRSRFFFLKKWKSSSGPSNRAANGRLITNTLH
jgi:hypothetical protein